MRRPLSAVCSLITGAALIVLPVAQAHAVQSYQVRFWGTIDIIDDEGWFADDEHEVVRFDETVTLTNAKRGDIIVVSGCAGGEVRGELTIYVDQTSDGQKVDIHARLFEGTSCENKDQDGVRTTTLTMNSAANGTGDTNFTSMKVTNEQEDVPGDSALFNISMSAIPV